MIYKNILDTIGGTPLVRLHKMAQKVELYAKIESFNPGSSVKDRIAVNMIVSAEKTGKLKPGDTIVEPTSGNTGIGLAMVAAQKGYKAVFTMPESMSVERRKILQFLGAQIVLTPASLGMEGSVDKAEELSRENGYFMPQQFRNPANPEVHRKTTAQEIIRELDRLDYFISGVGTGGTITGAGEVLKGHFNCRNIAVEPSGSPVLSGGTPGLHKIQGIGAGFIPDTFDRKVVDEIIQVSNEDAIATSRCLAQTEGVMAGISAGASLFVALQIARRPDAKVIVVVLPDTAERYLSTELFEVQND